MKAFLQFAGVLALIIVVVFFVLRGVVSVASKPTLVVRYPDAVRGRITGVETNRQNHLYFLDDDKQRHYSFNAFGPPLTPAQQQLSLEEQNALGLGQHLRVGDYVTKAANSTTLVVQRGGSTSQWFCAEGGPAN
jgi:hypothetical protein